MKDATFEVMDTIDIRGVNVVRYCDSTTTHNFEIKAIDGIYKEMLDELLDYENIGNGSFRVSCYNNRIYSISYETADCYEFSEHFAIEVAEAITIAIATLAKRQGGFDVIECE